LRATSGPGGSHVRVPAGAQGRQPVLGAPVGRLFDRRARPAAQYGWSTTSARRGRRNGAPRARRAGSAVLERTAELAPTRCCRARSSSAAG
jgi:hypothetical protein